MNQFFRSTASVSSRTKRGAVLLLVFVLVACVGCRRSKKSEIPLLPSATVETPSGVQEGIFEISYTVRDPFEEPVDVLVEFKTAGSEFALCTRAPGGTPVSGLATTKSGLSYTFRWSSAADSVALTSQVDTVQVRVTPTQPGAGGLPVRGYSGVSHTFSVDNSTGNSAPVVEITASPSGTLSGDVSVSYSISDAEADAGYVEALYRTAGMTGWEPATLSSATGGTVEGNFVVNMALPVAPAVYDLTWDSLTDLGLTYAYDVQIRIVGHDARPSAPVDTAIFIIDNTPSPEPPVVTLTTPASPSRGLVTLEYEVSDSNAESANITFEASLDGGATWQAAALVYSDTGQRVDNVVLGVPCLPAPEPHHVIWDSAADVGFVPNYVVRLRARPDASLVGIWAQTADFAVDNSSPAGGPQAVITADKLRIQTGEEINFSAMSSTGSPTTFLWSFGDGSYSWATEPAYTYDTGEGEFTVSLTVTDAAGLSDTAIEIVTVTEHPVEIYTDLEPYRNPVETRTLLSELAKQYPDIMTTYTIGYSVEGREIYVIKISDNVNTDEDEPVIHFDALHHAREVMTPEVIVDTIEQLVSNYGASSEVTDWVDNYEIYLVPCVNPDSSVAVFTTDRWIRKNARGVDPNRNYPADWGNPAGASHNPGSTTYCGPFAASEPEVQTIMAQVLKTRPAAAITYHSYSNIVLYPYCTPGLAQTSQESFIQQVSEDMAANMTRDIGGNYVAAHTLWYDASGVTPDWMYCDAGTLCVLVEVGADSTGGFFPEYGTYHDSQVQGVRGGVIELFRYMGRGAICGHVTDFDTAEPLEADISVSGFVNPNSEIRRSEPKFGSFYWLWQDGSFTVTFTLEGYAQQQRNITVAGVPYVIDVQLVKNATGNHCPSASFTTSMDKFDVGTTIILNATGSTDEDGDSLSCDWDFGDNETSDLPTVTHTFNRTGTHRVVLTVDDGNGGVHETWKLVHVMPVSDAPHISLLPLTGTWQRDVCVVYDMKAPVQCDCAIAVEYTSDGLVWHPATVAGADEGSISANTVSSIETTSELARHYFLWDSLADLGATGPEIIALKVTPYIPDQVYGDPAITNIFTVDNSSGNSRPSATLSVEDPPLSNDVAFTGTVSDPDYESCSLTVEYSLDSGASWDPATIVWCADGIIIGNVITGLAAAPAGGTTYNFDWDSYADLGASHVTGIWMRVTPNDSEEDGAPAIVTGLEVNNTGLVLTRPLSTDILDATGEVAWLWDSTAGGAEEDLVYEIDYAAGVGNVYFHDDFRVRPHDNWVFTGDSFWHRTEKAVVLDNNSGETGGVWYAGDISTNQWYCCFRFRITGGDSAPGFLFSFYSEPTTLEYPPDGYTLEFDARYDPSADPYDTSHIALLDGTGDHLCYVPHSGFCDGSWHAVEVCYKDGLLTVDMDAGNVLGYWLETPDTSHLRFGFSARRQAGYTYYLDDVLLCEHKPAWTHLVTTLDGIGTSAGAGSYTWDTSGVSSGADYVVRIRAYDGSTYSTYTYSDPFRVEHTGEPSVNLTDPSGIQRYEVALDFTLDDPTNDTCSVKVEYSPDSGANWYDAAIKSASAGTVDASSIMGLASGTTETYSVVWDAWRDLGENNNTGVRLQLTPKDILEGTPVETADFEVDNTAHAGELTGFGAAEDNGNVILSWTNPATPSLHGLLIRRRTDDFPADPGDGVLVFDSADTGAYFDNPNLSGPPALIRQDAVIDFSWGSGSPSNPPIPDNRFSAIWSATIDIATPGPYNFHTVTEDGTRLYINGDLIVDRWVAQPVTEYCGYKMLPRGVHKLLMEYHHNFGNAEAHLYLTGPGMTRVVVPLLPGRTVTFTDYGVSSGTTYYYTGFTYTPGSVFSTGAASARDSITVP